MQHYPDDDYKPLSPHSEIDPMGAIDYIVLASIIAACMVASVALGLWLGRGML